LILEKVNSIKRKSAPPQITLVNVVKGKYIYLKGKTNTGEAFQKRFMVEWLNNLLKNPILFYIIFAALINSKLLRVKSIE